MVVTYNEILFFYYYYFFIMKFLKSLNFMKLFFIAGEFSIS